MAPFRLCCSNLADQCGTGVVAPRVVGQALVGQAGGKTLEQSRTAYRSASLNLGFSLGANVFGL